MTTPQLIFIVIVVAVLVAVVAFVAWQAGSRRRSQRLQEHFGPEYEHVVKERSDKGEAEAELEARQERVEKLEIRPLDARSRTHYEERWRLTQARFVDEPVTAIDQADGLIGEVMTKRGYPMGDFEQRAADVSVDHPQVVDHYRTAHAIAMRARDGKADTEELRQAMLHYRALFADLLETGDREVATAAETPEPAGRPR